MIPTPDEVAEEERIVNDAFANKNKALAIERELSLCARVQKLEEQQYNMRGDRMDRHDVSVNIAMSFSKEGGVAVEYDYATTEYFSSFDEAAYWIRLQLMLLIPETNQKGEK